MLLFYYKVVYKNVCRIGPFGEGRALTFLVGVDYSTEIRSSKNVLTNKLNVFCSLIKLLYRLFRICEKTNTLLFVKTTHAVDDTVEKLEIA